jgi:hypothetical protein
LSFWTVSLKDGTDLKDQLKLQDSREYFEGYLKLSRNFFNQLIKAEKVTKNYIIKQGIESVENPKNDDWTLNPWILVITKDNEKEAPFWFLFKRELDLSGILVAIGPDSFIRYLNNDKSEARKDIQRIIKYLIIYLKKFDCIIFLPNYLV